MQVNNRDAALLWDMIHSIVDFPQQSSTTQRITMQLEEYFDFLSDDDIRIRGHRIGIDNVLEYFLEGYTPEEIVATYPDLALEKIYATTTYYLHNRSKIDAYLLRLRQQREQRYHDWAANPSPMALRMRAIKAQLGLGQARSN